MKTLPDLRNWQKIALSRWIENGFTGSLEVATGGGKTTFALAAFSELKKRNPKIKILVIVPTNALADQWSVNFEEDLGIEESEIQVLSSQCLDVNKLVNICVINTARNFNRKVKNCEEIFLVVDECHRSGSEENSRALIENTYATLGLSATPFRDFDEGFKNFIEPVLGSVIFTYSLDDAIKDGILADMKITNIRIPLLESETAEFNDLSSKIARAYSQDADQNIIDSLLRRRSRLYNNAFYRVPAILSVMENFRSERTIIFLESIVSAQEAKDLLDKHKHSVTIYHSQLSDSARRTNLKMFRRGVFDVLIACRALDEGFNVPEAKVAIIGAGTSSRRQRIQRMGRVLRSIAGKEKAEVITIYATDVEEARLSQESQKLSQVVSIEWKSMIHDR